MLVGEQVLCAQESHCEFEVLSPAAEGSMTGSTPGPNERGLIKSRESQQPHAARWSRREHNSGHSDFRPLHEGFPPGWRSIKMPFDFAFILFFPLFHPVT